MFHAYAATEPGGQLKPFEYDPGEMQSNDVDIKIEYCGICHSDLSMLDNEWGMSAYPFVPGHEIIGTVEAIGDQVSNLQVGQRVGVGWFSETCMSCEWCLGGDHNFCANQQGTILGRHGGFADRIRVNANWAFPLPAGIDPAVAGPLLCAGITVFNPMLQFDVKSTDRVGVIGIGGLGHLALRFLDAWGCDVTAFSSSADKEDEARGFGADHFVNSRDSEALKGIAGSLDYIICTVNASLDWPSYLNTLRPRGHLHLVGAVLEPLSIPFFSLLQGQKTISASPTGSPNTMREMLDFAARHKIEPAVESYSFDQVNEAMDKLRNGKPRYRLVLTR
jgi:uncharacterized zinc-type alcohol dehydrogenase-like protein